MIHVHDNNENGYLVCYAPFSKEEIEAINEHQINSTYPYLCKQCQGVVLANKNGMSCVEAHDVQISVGFTL